MDVQVAADVVVCTDIYVSVVASLSEGHLVDFPSDSREEMLSMRLSGLVTA